jgi:hypothetical protein
MTKWPPAFRLHGVVIEPVEDLGEFGGAGGAALLALVVLNDLPWSS